MIVALGDSLTVGYQLTDDEDWIGFTPYTVFFNERLSELGQREGLQFQIHNKGILGEVTSEMLARFGRDVLNLKPNFVIIMGGTNDLGGGAPPVDVLGNLTRMYDAALKNDIKIIACSIPSILGCDSLIAPRVALNEMIRLHCAQNGMAFADVFGATADPKTNRLIDHYSSDGIHLSTLGYKKMADTIYEEALEGLLSMYLSKHK